jgi:DnaJ like chaperone protein
MPMNLLIINRILSVISISFAAYFWVTRYSALPFQFRKILPLVPSRKKFLFYLFSLAAKMAKADGRVSEDEIRVFRRYVRSNFRISSREERKAAVVFRDATCSPTQFSELAKRFVNEFKNEPAVLFAMLDLLADIAAADGIVAPSEYTLLKQFSELIELRPHRFVSMMSVKFRQLGVEAPFDNTAKEKPIRENTFYDQKNPLQKAYRTLGIPLDASWELTRTTYRKLAKQYHPDRLRSRGVPDSGIRSATEHFRSLKDAYELIRQHKGK